MLAKIEACRSPASDVPYWLLLFPIDYKFKSSRIYIEMSKEQWDLGGLTDKEGNLGRLVPSGHVIVPGKIDLVGDNLRWEWTSTTRSVEISRSTLNDFVRLWREDSAAILKFARRWGVLAIQVMRKNDPLYRPCSDLAYKGEDPIHAWSYFSRRASAVLAIASALNQERFGDLDDWKTLLSWIDPRWRIPRQLSNTNQLGLASI